MLISVLSVMPASIEMGSKLHILTISSPFSTVGGQGCKGDLLTNQMAPENYPHGELKSQDIETLV